MAVLAEELHFLLDGCSPNRCLCLYQNLMHIPNCLPTRAPFRTRSTAPGNLAFIVVFKASIKGERKDSHDTPGTPSKKYSNSVFVKERNQVRSTNQVRTQFVLYRIPIGHFVSTQYFKYLSPHSNDTFFVRFKQGY